MKNLPQDGPLGAVGKAWGTEGKPSGLRDEESQRERLVRAFSRGWVQEKAQCEPPTGRSRKGRNPCGKGRSWEINFRRLRGELGLEQAEEARVSLRGPKMLPASPTGSPGHKVPGEVPDQSQKGSPRGSEGLCPFQGAGLPKSHRATKPLVVFLGREGWGGGAGWKAEALLRTLPEAD